MSRLIRKNKTLYSIAKTFYQLTHPTPSNYEFAIETTTYCNMRCRFCTNNELITNQQRPLKHLTMDQLSKTLDFIEDFPKPKGKKITINATGLGEPFTNMYFTDILHAIKDRGLNLVGFATNGTLLNDDNIQEILDLHLPVVCVSLRFTDRERYAAHSKDDYYDKVVDNIIKFLSHQRPPNEALHICLFENEDFPRAQKEWEQLMQPQDRLYLTPRFDMFNFLRRSEKVRTEPCRAMYSSLIIDVDGNVYPCCMGLWLPANKNLYLGNIYQDSVSSVSWNLKAFLDYPFHEEPCSYCPQR